MGYYERRVSPPTGSTDVEACVDDIKALLGLSVRSYLMEPGPLDELSRGLELSTDIVADMPYVEVCRRLSCRYSDMGTGREIPGGAIWALAEPYLREYERQQCGNDCGSRAGTSWAQDVDPHCAAPFSLAKYTFYTYYLALCGIYGEDEALAEDLFHGIFEAGCGGDVVLYKYVHYVHEMRFIPQEKIVYDLLIRPYLGNPVDGN